MIRQKLRIMVIGAQKKYTPFGVYFIFILYPVWGIFFSIVKNKPQTGYIKIGYTSNEVQLWWFKSNLGERS